MPKRDGAARRQQQRRAPPRETWNTIYLRQWREYRRLTQEQLSELSGVSIAEISLIESKKSNGSAGSLQRLAKALQITVGELLDVNPGDDGQMVRAWIRSDDLPTVKIMLDGLTRRK